MINLEQLKGNPPYSIGKVSKVTGLSTHVIRVWERRYKAIEPQRTEGKSRRYSEEEIYRLFLFKKLTDQGHAIGGIANLPTETLCQLVGAELPAEDKMVVFAEDTQTRDQITITQEQKNPNALIEDFLTAIRNLDSIAAEQLLTSAALSIPAIELLQKVIQPTLWKVGELWERGEFRPSHEHTASAAMRSLLGSLLRIHRDPQVNKTVAFGTLRGDLHEFGALMAALRAAVFGWNVLYLGPNLPPEEIAFAAHKGKASLVVVSAVYGQKRKIREQVIALRDLLHDEISLIVGGSGVNPRKPFEGASILNALEDLDSHLMLN